MNRVELVGGLVQDPVLRALPSGTFVCEFSMGIKEPFWSSKDHEDKVRSHYIRCVAWGELAERVGETYHRGDQLYVLGSLTQEVIEKEDGKKDSKTKVRCVAVTGVYRRPAGGRDDDGGVEPPF